MSVLFLSGVATFFTPCVFPLIPVYLAAIVGATVSSSRRLVVYATAFSSGIVLVFSLLGAVAAALGGLVKSQQHFLLLGGGILVLLFGLKFVGLIQIPLLDRVVRLDEKRFSSRIGIVNAFLMGFVFGAGWSPCVGPLLGSALVYATALGSSPLRGMALLAVYGIGFVTPFVVTALFADRLVPLMKRFNRALPLFERGVGLLLVAGAGYLLLSAVTPAAPEKSAYAQPSTASHSFFDEFPLPDGLPALVEFYSAECPVCKRMEPIVQRIFERCDGDKVTLRRIDISHPENRRYITQYRILGVPTFVLFAPDRTEVARLIGAQTEEAIYQALATLRGEQCEGVSPVPGDAAGATVPGTTCTD